MESVTLRPARADERWLILRRVLREGLDPTNLHWRRFIMAEDGEGQIVGFAQLKELGQGVQEFGSLVVEKSVRRQGIGGALIRYFQETAEPPLYLFCGAHRVRYYSKFGYRLLKDPESAPVPLRKKWQKGLFIARFFRARFAVMIYSG